VLLISHEDKKSNDEKKKLGTLAAAEAAVKKPRKLAADSR
jgi:hypothetical protein